ncbi:hypothetical protein D3Z48_17100 [Clostridiaceae bacterium]|nr:hypothetical protein [Clostridiaceae bacterium]
MRKAILTVLMVLVLVIPAYAAEGDAATDQPIQQEQEPVVVATLDELQDAIDAAEDGDTIALDATIKMLDGDTLVTDKHITLVRHEGLKKSGGRMIEIYGDGVISGFSFVENGLVSSSTITTRAEGNGEITIENCSFKAAGDNGILHFIMADIGDLVTIRGCTFYCGNGYVIYSQRETNVLLDSCTFLKGNYYTWQMIAAYGEMAIENCTFDAGTGYMTAALDGKITISNCQMNTNYFKKRIYPNVYLEDKISGAGTISILDEAIEGEGFYDLYTGEKEELPITEIDDLSVLAYMTDEQAAEYFAVESHIGRFDIKVDERSGHFDEDEPEKPGIIPDTDPEQPTEPPQDDTPDNPADTTPTTPPPPQKPSDSGNSGDDDYTPPIDYRPSQRPTKPTEDDKPQEQPDIPATTKPQLACNGAVIDTSRTVVLLGYGDGLLHEDDPLTRAQLATIIYRLLDDESIAKYSNTELAFTDVAPDAWYAPYVKTINGSGIVQGVGGGKYSPNSYVTWSQIITVLTRFVQPQEHTLQHIQYSGWAQGAIETAVANGWLEDRADFNPDAVISRGELVQLINNVLALYR